MGVKDEKELLLKAAKAFDESKKAEENLLRAALSFSKAKRKARNARDKWRYRKALKESELSNDLGFDSNRSGRIDSDDD